jgi:hypothetical protein
MNEDIITAASKAGFETKRDTIWVDTWEITPTLARFAALIRADEREACVEAVRKEWMDGSKPTFLRDLENAIRARSHA